MCLLKQIITHKVLSTFIVYIHLDSYHDDLEQAYHKEYYALSAQEEEYRANYIRQRSEHELTFEELQREKKRELMK
ncbi:hypothetical protein B7934_08655 [Streptococcus agalactiae]|nr:hypothetical protein B7934_08655 [Streptococcus agalactiae]CCW40775.1 Unknown [Streptococcus agalactiae ILRI005]